MRRIFLLLSLIAMLGIDAQQTELSPYSRFGLGDPSIGSYPAQMGLGGTGVAVIDGIHINSLNPALQSFLLSPTFEFGISNERLKTTSESSSVSNSTTRLNHFAVGFPMWNGKWGASFGLSPYTDIGYRNSQTIYSAEIDNSYTAEYNGSGGINKMFLDIGRELRIKEDTSRYNHHTLLGLGVGMKYLFGSIASERNTVFPLNSGFISTRIEDATTINDFTVDGGVLLRHFLDRRTSKEDSMFVILNVGATFSQEQSLNASRSRDVFGYVQNASGIEFSRDSVNSFSDQEGTISIPTTMKVGTSLEFYREKNGRRNVWRKFTFAADYSQTDWTTTKEDFDVERRYDGLGKQSAISMGIAYRPNTSVTTTDRGKYTQLSTYRVGFRTGTSHLDIDGQALSESGISFGMSIPLLLGGIKRSDSQFDFAVEYGTRGTTDAGLLKEDFVRVMIGFSFHPEGYDQWFKKSKYD